MRSSRVALPAVTQDQTRRSRDAIVAVGLSAPSGVRIYTRTTLCAQVTATRLPAGFAGVEPPETWAPTRAALRPARLEAGVDVIEGVGPALRSKLARLGVRTV